MSLLDTIFSTRVALNGVEVVTRKILNFVGVTIEDDPANGRTNITVSAATLGNRTATSVLGRAAGTAGAAADIVASADDRMLARVAGALSFVQLTLGMIPNSLITAAKLTGVQEMLYSAASASRALDAGDYYRTMVVDSSGGARVITLPKNATLAIPVGAWGVIVRDGANDVSVAAEDGAVTVKSSGTELKAARDQAHLYWEKRATNTYWIGGEKKV